MEPDTTHRLTRLELALLLAALTAGVVGSFFYPMGFAA